MEADRGEATNLPGAGDPAQGMPEAEVSRQRRPIIPVSSPGNDVKSQSKRDQSGWRERSEINDRSAKRFACAAVTVLAGLLAGNAIAQEIDGHPDFSGLWTTYRGPTGNGAARGGPAGQAGDVPLTPMAREKVDAYRAVTEGTNHSPGAYCVGSGMPSSSEEDGRRVLTNEWTMTDPLFLEEPMSGVKRWQQVEGGRLMNYECTEPEWLDIVQRLLADEEIGYQGE